MSAVGYESLRTAKAALDEGLINANDFDEIKTAFLRAQQIKAGLDAGFIREVDYQNVKKAFLNSLNLSSDPGAVAGSIPAATGNSLLQHSSLPNLPSAAAAAPQPPPPPPPPPAANGTTAHHQGAAPAGDSTITPRGSGLPPIHSNSVSSTPSRDPSPRGRTAVPTNIPKMGGARPKQTGSTSMSGISVTEDAVNLYYYLKAKSVYRWATWKINDAGNQVIISDVGEKDSSYSEFLAVLPASDCRYGVIDMKFTNSEGCVFNKILFVNWAPDSARIKAKMMYASTKDFFKGYLDGLSIELQGSDLEDINEEEANAAVRSSVTRQ